MSRCISIHTACRSSSTSWSDYDIQLTIKRSRSLLFPFRPRALAVVCVPDYTNTSKSHLKLPKCSDYNYQGTLFGPFWFHQHSEVYTYTTELGGCYCINQPRTNFGSVHVLWWYNYNEKASLAVVCRLTKKDINNGFCLLVICPADLLLLVIHLITISTLGLTIGCASFKNFSSSSY